MFHQIACHVIINSLELLRTVRDILSHYWTDLDKICRALTSISVLSRSTFSGSTGTWPRVSKCCNVWGTQGTSLSMDSSVVVASSRAGSRHDRCIDNWRDRSVHLLFKFSTCLCRFSLTSLSLGRAAVNTENNGASFSFSSTRALLWLARSCTECTICCCYYCWYCEQCYYCIKFDLILNSVIIITF